MHRTELLKRMLEFTASPVTVFGRDYRAAHSFYLRLARELHPDSPTGSTEAFQQLEMQWGLYDSNPLQFLRSNEICQIYLGVNDVEHKTLIYADSRDLFDNEINVLRQLRRISIFSIYQTNYPHIIGVWGQELGLSYFFNDPNEEGLSRISPVELVTLAQARLVYGNELNIRHLGWIWHRLVWFLGFIHRHGIVHAGITPESILIGPKEHDVVLVDWNYTSMNQEPLIATNSSWLGLYPPLLQDVNAPIQDVRNHTIPGLDFYMAAKVMLAIFPHMPDELSVYFTGLMIPDVLRAVVTDAVVLTHRFDNIIYGQLGWPEEYVPMEWIHWEDMRNE